MGDGNVREAAYRGGWKPASEPPEGAIRHGGPIERCPPRGSGAAARSELLLVPNPLPQAALSGVSLRNCVMPKPSQPPRSPTEADQDPVWGDLFGFVRPPRPNPAPIEDAPTPAPPSPRQQPKRPKKPRTKRVPPSGGRSR